jgi:hypothetical protein
MMMQGQQAVERDCVLDGTAVDFGTAEPLRKVTIRLVPSFGWAAGYMATTDSAGHFQLSGVREGDYVLTGERTGYLTSEFGTRQPGASGTTLHLKAGDKLRDLTVKLARCPVLSGKILDEQGQPLEKVLVYAVYPYWLRGQREYQRSDGVWTNDEGEFRITNLPPGHYLLCAEGSFRSFVEKQGGKEERVLSTCYPDARNPEGAERFAVKAGEELAGMDLRMPVGAVFHIRGKLASGSLSEKTGLVLEAHAHNFSNAIFDLDREEKDDGSFDFSGAAAGTYDIELSSDEQKQVITRLNVAVKGSDLNGLVVPVPNKVTVKGIVRSMNPDNIAPLALDPIARDLHSPASEPYDIDIQPDGTFKIALWPGEYVFALSGYSPGAYIQSILYNGVELPNGLVTLTSGAAQIELVVGGGAGLVEGTVQPSDSEKNVGGLNVVLAAEPARSDDAGLLRAKTDQDGHFLLKGVPPGKYYALAISGVDPELLENRDFIGQIQQSGTEVELVPDGHLQIRPPILSKGDLQRALSKLGL